MRATCRHCISRCLQNRTSPRNNTNEHNFSRSEGCACRWRGLSQRQYRGVGAGRGRTCSNIGSTDDIGKERANAGRELASVASPTAVSFAGREGIRQEGGSIVPGGLVMTSFRSFRTGARAPDAWRHAVAALALAVGLLAAAPPATGQVASLAPGVIAVIDRKEIEMSGMTDLAGLLSGRSAFNVYGITGLSSGRGVTYTLDGRWTTGLDLGTLPLSAVERVEIKDEGEARISRRTAGVIVNVMLKHGIEGLEITGSLGMPASEGADMRHGGAVWGGSLGRGRVLVAVDRTSSQEVPDAARDFSRAKWTHGGSFAGTQGVSVGGNTIYVDGVGARALGECDTDIYAGVLLNPRGVAGEGCGFAYADIAWLDAGSRSSRESLLLGMDHPIGDDAGMYLEVLGARSEAHSRYAPSVGSFTFVPAGSVRDGIIDAVAGLTADDLPEGAEVSVDHRFVAHGNRDWLADTDRSSVTLGFHGTLAHGLEYDVRGSMDRSRSRGVADTFVSRELVTEAVEAGEYLVADPLSTDPVHLEAVRRTAVSRFRDTDTEYRVLRAELAGPAFRLPGGPAGWTLALDVVDTDWRDILDYRAGGRQPPRSNGRAGHRRRLRRREAGHGKPPCRRDPAGPSEPGPASVRAA